MSDCVATMRLNCAARACIHRIAASVRSSRSFWWSMAAPSPRSRRFGRARRRGMPRFYQISPSMAQRLSGTHECQPDSSSTEQSNEPTQATGTRTFTTSTFIGRPGPRMRAAFTPKLSTSCGWRPVRPSRSMPDFKTSVVRLPTKRFQKSKGRSKRGRSARHVQTETSIAKRA
jgi:hypothetical protein